MIKEYLELIYPNELYITEKDYNGDDFWERNSCLDCKYAYYEDIDDMLCCKKKKSFCPRIDLYIDGELLPKGKITDVYNCCEDFEYEEK